MLERIYNVNKLLANNPAWAGTQPLPDDTPAWVVIMWEKALGAYVPPFVPTFRSVTGTDGQMVWPLPDSDYFASMATAEEMAKRYGDVDDKSVHEVDFGGTGGMFSVDQKEFHITVNGESKNAGLIAAYYRRNPEDLYPGVADRSIKKVLGLA